MNLVALSRILTFVASAGVAAGTALAAGQVPAGWQPWAALLAALGTVCAKWSKTPSQAIAAAVPPAKAPAPPTP